MNISKRISKPIVTLFVQMVIIIAAAALWAPNIMARAAYFNACVGCHGSTPEQKAFTAQINTITLENTPTHPETTCVSCHEHAAKDTPLSSLVTRSAQPQQQVVTPGTTFKVNVTGGNIGNDATGALRPRNGNVRLRLYDAAGAILVDGHGSLGLNRQPGITVDATAPATIGQFNWQVAWLGNTLLNNTGLDNSTWPTNPDAKGTPEQPIPHGERRVNFSFFVCNDNDNDGYFSANCQAPEITPDCNDADATKTVVCSVNIPPIANAGLDRTVAEGSTVNWDGNLSADANNDSLTFNWTMVAKPANSTSVMSNATSAKPSFVADKPGSYSIQLVVNDGTVTSAIDTVIINANTKPVANAGNPQTVVEETPITRDGNNSFDAENDPLTYIWTITASPQGSTATLSGSTSATPGFVPDTAGSYTFQLPYQPL